MMHHFSHLLHAYGYPAITAIVGLECAGIILPGETMLVVAALAASHGKLNIGLVVAAAAVGGVLGNIVGYGIGHLLGDQVLARHGWRIGLNSRRLALGRYMYARHGGKMVFLSRYAAVLRSFSGLLAGANAMPWRSFLLWTVVGGIAWATTIGFGAFWLGNKAKQLTGTASLAFAAGTIALIALIIYLARRNEHRLTEQALAWERASARCEREAV
jgi:membrane protein DedA with SNARE-associated domain